MKHLAAALMILTSAASAVQAEGRVVLVELFTSQGCSSCPPADALFEELAGRDDVLALALHVPYWDYIGWKDDLADPAWTERQRAYAHAAGKTMIYTPQMVIDGETHVVGNRPMDVARALREHAAGGEPLRLTVTRSGAVVTIAAEAVGAVPDGSLVQFVTYLPEAVRDITRGENAGQVITYRNIVRSLVTIGTLSGGHFSGTAEVPGGLEAAVMVQAPGAGEVYAVARPR